MPLPARVDLGIAKFHRRAPTARGTTPGTIIGTIQYMAPEQLEGAEADPRIDVYALGLILVEMLTGRLPWGETRELTVGESTLRLIVPPAPLSKLRPEQPFSPELVKLVEDMLALDANKRPASGGELFHRLKYVPEAPAALRADGGDRASSSGLAAFGRPGVTPLPAAADDQGAPDRSRSLLLRHRALAVVTGLVLSLGLLLGYLVFQKRHSAPAVSAAAPDKVPAPPPAVKPSIGPPPVDKTAEQSAAPAVKTPHRPAHASGTLRVQFAFTEAKGVTLTCGGKKQPPPDCSAGGICKSVAVVLAGQRCTAEKGAAKAMFTYSDLQKNPPDRKNLIHILVRLP